MKMSPEKRYWFTVFNTSIDKCIQINKSYMYMLLIVYDYFAILTSSGLKVKISEIVSTCTINILCW